MPNVYEIILEDGNSIRRQVNTQNDINWIKHNGEFYEVIFHHEYPHVKVDCKIKVYKTIGKLKLTK